MAKIRNPLTYMGGGSPTPPAPQPLDPEQVYQNTRPSGWLVMPTPQANEAYMLYHIDYDCVDNQTICTSVLQSSGDTTTLEVGTTDSQGNFTANPTYTVTSTDTSTILSTTVPASAYGDTLPNGKKQLMCKVSTTGNMRALWQNDAKFKVWYKPMVEIAVNAPLDGGTLGGNDRILSYSSLVYASFEGITNSSIAGLFSSCYSLKAVRKLETSSNTTNFSSLFSNCHSLVAIPQLDTSNVTNFYSMFSNCYSMVAIPALDTANGTNFGVMFSYCTSLKAIPSIDTSSGTNFNGIFSNCTSITEIPMFNTSNGTDLSNMFSGCVGITEVPLLNTSNGTDFIGVFYGCCSIKSVPLWDTSSGTTFNSMFKNCSSITEIPLIDTSGGENFGDMFSGCSSLKTIPLLDTSSGMVFNAMFEKCLSITEIPLIDTSSGEDFGSMFSGCSSLMTIPLLDTSNGFEFSNMFSGCESLSYIPQIDTSTGESFEGMFQSCQNLQNVPQLNTANGFYFAGMFNRCFGLTSADFTNFDFGMVDDDQALRDMFGNLRGSGLTVILGDSWGNDGIINRSRIMSTLTGMQDGGVKVRIDKTDGMLPIAVSATTLFSSSSNIVIYVPDDLLATYQADTYWGTLGTRLKAISEWSA